MLSVTSRARGREFAALRLLILAGCLIVALAVAACGGTRRNPPPSHEVDLTKLGGSSQASQRQPVAVFRPRRGDTLVPIRLRDGQMELSATVTGRAQPYQSIRVSAPCSESACTRYVSSDRDGNWRVRLDLVLGLRRTLLLSADYALPHGGHTGSKLRVRIKPPKPQSSPGRNTSPTLPAAGAPPPTSAPHSLVLIGDSLAVGIKPLLPSLLPGWKVAVDGRVSRPLAEGMGILARTHVPSDGSTVLAISLFTNDDPRHLAALQQAVQTTLARVGPRGCVLWATIVSHPVAGATFAKANALLERLAAEDPRLRLVPWARAVQQTPSILSPDGVHPTPQGYQLRAQLYAQAAQSCS